MEKEILLQAAAGAVGSHSSEAAMGPARQEDTAWRLSLLHSKTVPVWLLPPAADQGQARSPSAASLPCCSTATAAHLLEALNGRQAIYLIHFGKAYIKQ